MTNQFVRITGFASLGLKQAFESGQASTEDDLNPYGTEMEDNTGKMYCPMAEQRDAWFLGTVNDVATMQNVIDKHNASLDKAHSERLAKKGHDCDEYVVHKFDTNDYYICGECGDLLQVG